MARPTKEERLGKVHEEALREFDTVQSALRDERLQCLQDRRFYSIAGAMWEGPLGLQFENKPKFEVNKIMLAVIRIFNEYRNNRITVQFQPKNGRKNDELSDTCNGLYRADEQDSGAEEAYDNAFDEAVGGGFGAWRLRAAYEDDEDADDEYQRIRIEPIFDADSSVFFDLNAKRQDKADAKRCWVITSMSRVAYKDEYGDDPASWPKTIHQYEFDWLTPDVVYIAEYYEREEFKDLIVVFEGLDGQKERHRQAELDADPAFVEKLQATGFREVSQKKVRRYRVHKYLLSGAGILEDCGYIAGQCIPIVPVYGKRWFVDNVERCMGHVRLPKDMQRLKNMQMSKLGEVAALSSVEKPIFTPQEIAGHQVMWSEDNVKNFPYLLKNRAIDAGGNPIQTQQEYTKVPQVAPAMAALLQLTEQDMQDMLGNQQSGEEIVSNIAEKTVELFQDKLGMQTFIYISNFAKAVKRSGEIWLSMAKDVMVEEGRVMKTIDQQGEVGDVELMRPVMDEDSGEMRYENDLTDAKFDVNVEVGPTSSSKRKATVRTLTDMVQITDDPDTKQVLGAMAMMNMEGEGIIEVRDYFRQKLIKMGVVKPTDDEAQKLQKELAAQPEDPNATFLKAEAGKADALARKAVADTELTMQKVTESQATTVKTLAEAEEVGHESFRRSVDALGNAFQDQSAGLMMQ